MTLNDTAVLAGGFSPTGTITFTLHQGSTLVDTEMVAVTGNGTYTTPTGFTLPATGTVTGTYQWDATYSGDTNNGSVSDNNAANEQVTVTAADPTITTTPSPSTAMLGARLQDVADLAGGYHATGSITFMLYAPGVDPTVGPATYTETVTAANGNGTYQTTVGFVSNATGVWHWVATYGGDSNNNSASNGALAEPVTIASQADLALTKTVNNPTPNVGDTITYTVTLTNSGPDRATGVQVEEQLPTGLLFVSATPSEGTYDASTGLWVVGTVDVGFPETLVIVAQITSTEPVTNMAMIIHSDQFDPNPSNDVAAEVVRPNALPPPTVTTLQRFGFHAQPTELVLTFSSAMDLTPAQVSLNYTLNPIGSNGHLGSRIPIASAVYAPLSHTVTLRFAKPVYLFRHYRLVVNGMPLAGLSSTSGVFLDGQGKGVPGTNYVKVFGRSILAGRSIPVGSHPRSPATARRDTPHAHSAVRHSSIAAPRSHQLASTAVGERAPATPANAAPARLSTDALDAVLESLVSSRRSRDHRRIEPLARR